jgi:hypothetical protein
MPPISKGAVTPPHLPLQGLLLTPCPARPQHRLLILVRLLLPHLRQLRPRRHRVWAVAQPHALAIEHLLT